MSKDVQTRSFYKACQDTLMSASAASITRALLDSAVFPLYLASNTLQTQGAYQQPPQYNSSMSVLKGICQKEGFKRVYKGMPTVISAAVPGNLLFFATITIGNELTQNRPCGAALTGYVAQVAASLAYVPATIMSDAQQSRQLRSQWQRSDLTVYQFIKKQGLGSLYKGFWPHTLSYGACNALALTMIQYLQSNNTPKNQSTHLITSLASYWLAAAVTTPLEITRRRLQFHNFDPKNFPDTKFHHAAYGIVQREGVRGLFAGTISRSCWLSLRTAPALFISQKVFDKISSEADNRAQPTPHI